MAQQVTLREAADRLGVSIDTIRRRLKAGELTGELRRAKQGDVWYVELPGDVPAAPVTPPSESVGRDRLIEQLRQDLVGRDRQIEQMRAEIDGLRRELEAEREHGVELKDDRDAWRSTAIRESERHAEAEGELRRLLLQAQTLITPIAATSQTPQDGPSASSSAPAGISTPQQPKPSLWKRIVGS